MPATDFFSKIKSWSPSGFGGPYRHAAVITKSDTVDLDFVSGAIYVGGTGHMKVLTAEDETVLFSAIPAGAVLPIRIKRVFSTDTTATLMVALW